VSEPQLPELPEPMGAGDPRARRASLALFLAGLAVFALIYTPQPLLPELSRKFGVSPAGAALSVGLTTLGLAVGLLVGGPVSERVGRTPLVHFSLAAGSVLGLLCAASPSWTAGPCRALP
jgi:YNFM family putative membrane transporter